MTALLGHDCQNIILNNYLLKFPDKLIQNTAILWRFSFFESPCNFLGRARWS